MESERQIALKTKNTKQAARLFRAACLYVDKLGEVISDQDLLCQPAGYGTA